ncbi:LysR family transcriptional regulator [Microbacterium sp. 4R-513]|nr:LysR family transcriptional regulator [Microbacterium sp. 4R-513]
MLAEPSVAALPRPDRALRATPGRSGSAELSAAARVLGLTQPAVSTQLKALEQVVGEQLFMRGARGAAPTPAVAEGVRVQLVPGLPDALFDALRAGTLDLVIASQRPPGRTMTAEPLADARASDPR